MASQALQAKANALNAKMEASASKILDDIERYHVRKVARASFACAVACYDKAGSTAAAQSLETCARNCQVPYQQAGAMVQQEVGQFQNRLNRNMAECQERARDMMQPGMENDARKMAKVEDTLLQCMYKTVDEHISMLQPMQDRIKSALKDFK